MFPKIYESLVEEERGRWVALDPTNVHDFVYGFQKYLSLYEVEVVDGWPLMQPMNIILFVVSKPIFVIG